MRCAGCLTRGCSPVCWWAKFWLAFWSEMATRPAPTPRVWLGRPVAASRHLHIVSRTPSLVPALREIQ